MYFQVEGTNLRIAGSMHFFPQDHLEMPAWLWEAFDWADTLFFEADVRGLSPFVQRSDGSTLRDSLPPNLSEALFSLMPNQQVAAAWNGLKLPFASLGAISLIAPTCDGVELQMLARLGKPRPYKSFHGVTSRPSREPFFFESQAQHVDILDSIADTEYLEAMAWALFNQKEALDLFHEMYQAWSSGRLDNMAAVFPRTFFGKWPEAHQCGILNRNRNWMPALELSAKSRNRTLVAIGAGHLSGAGGVLDLLEKAGYSIKPLLN